MWDGQRIHLKRQHQGDRCVNDTPGAKGSALHQHCILPCVWPVIYTIFLDLPNTCSWSRFDHIPWIMKYCYWWLQFMQGVKYSYSISSERKRDGWALFDSYNCTIFNKFCLPLKTCNLICSQIFCFINLNCIITHLIVYISEPFFSRANTLTKEKFVFSLLFFAYFVLVNHERTCVSIDQLCPFIKLNAVC